MFLQLGIAIVNDFKSIEGDRQMGLQVWITELPSMFVSSIVMRSPLLVASLKSGVSIS